MSRRGKEISEQLAIKHMEAAGIGKAHAGGAGIADYYRPAGEMIAKAEKTLASVVRAQEKLLDRTEEQSRWQRELTDFSEQLLIRYEALVRPQAYDSFIPGEWRMSRANGHNLNIPASNGEIPRERPV